MAIETLRGCGYRKVGGIYLVGSVTGIGCGKLPIALVECPTCGQGIKQSRGWTWVNPSKLIGRKNCSNHKDLCAGRCVLSDVKKLGDKAGLLWIGQQFYPSHQAFFSEAEQLGISKRISKIPRGFKLNETAVLLAHPAGLYKLPKYEPIPAIVGAFIPTGIEKIVTQSALDSMSTEDIEHHKKLGIRLVPVPDDDLDHQGSENKQHTKEIFHG